SAAYTARHRIEESDVAPYCRLCPQTVQAKDETMDDARLIDIEVKLAHQEQAMAELNQVLIDQQAQLTRLAQRYEGLTEKIDSLSQSGTRVSADDERPPHY
ncbi:MAG TPA: SlyX family protein, partial [Woeseiaceae bacterium]